MNRFLIKYELKKVFYTELITEKERFIKKLKEISEINFTTRFLLVTDIFLPEKVKYVGNFSKKHIKLRERNYPFKKYISKSIIKIDLESKDNLLLIKTSVQGFSYLRFILNTLFFLVTSTISIILLFELQFVTSLILLLTSYLYLFFSYKNTKKNVEKIMKELSSFYNTIEEK